MIKGLSNEEANTKLKKEGKNILKEDKKQNIFIIFFRGLLSPSIILLCIASILSFFIKEYVDGCIILFVILLNTFIATFEEFKASKAIDSLKKMSSSYSLVRRSGNVIRIPSYDIVVGDAIILQEGDVIPADMILKESLSLQVDESLLSGESLPIYKNNEDTLYASSFVISGKGEGYAVKCGMNTEIGKIASSLKEKENENSPLQNKLNHISKVLSFSVVSIMLFLFFFLLAKGNDFFAVLVLSISIAVAIIPEGLDSVVTIVLALSINKLSKKKVIVRKLKAIETLGNVEILCSDKTGTITRNELKVKDICYCKNEESLLLDAMRYTNSLVNEDGDPLEKAVYSYAKEKSNSSFELVSSIPFTSERKMMSVIGLYQDKTTLFTKGAEEEIIKKCNSILYKNKIVPLDDKMKKYIEKQVDKMTSIALRVIAYAYSFSSVSENELTFLGLVGLADSPRRGVKEEINKLKNAGIKVIMITGDNIDTAFQIGKEVGICSSKEECLLGEEINTKENLDRYSVFARVSPFHKVDIVSYYKEKGKVVAMTGDGVNDSLSLKKADVSIAMGKRGSEVAKSVSSLVIKDDNFLTISLGIKEGRKIYVNIKKSILFLLSSNLGEILVMLCFILLGLPLPLLSLHILWVNLISDSLPSIALGLDEEYDDLMNDPPRGHNGSFFDKKGILTISLYGGLIFLLTLLGFFISPLQTCIAQGYDLSIKNILYVLEFDSVLLKSRTIAFSTLCISQLFHMFGMSSSTHSLISILKKKNYIMILSFLGGLVLQLGIIEIDLFRNFFHLSDLSFKEWICVFLLSIEPLVVHEVIAKK
ncbi:MAG: cation-translocating P-type ATPase [Bacilli bacterium]